MGIIYCEKDRIFTLQTKNTTYQMQVDRYGFLLHLYYGKKTDTCMDYLLTYYDRGFSGNPYDAGEDRTYSMDTLPQEFPCYGNGDFRSTAFAVENADGSMSCDLRYKSHKIFDGKYNLEGLPAVYASEEEAQTLEILMEDPVTGVKVVLLYGVLSAQDIITRSVCVKNESSGKIFLNKIESASLDFLYGDYELLTFYGRHAMERNVQRVPVVHGTQKIGSVRGTSSHQYNPMMILAEKETTEDKGNCYAMSFVYSGCFQGEVLKDQLNQTRMMLGLQEEAFRYPLETGEMFQAPEVILSYSSEGMNRLSQNLHHCIRQHICRGKYKEEIRPILINSWEAAYFDFTGDTIYELAKAAKEVNIDMLVMDDGWFGKRDDDNSGLGDWFVNEKKLGGTLGNLIKRINDLGVKFGIWIEPEMVSEDSDLYRKHPDWALTVPGRNPVRSRNQLVLDFSRKEVVDAIYDQICKVLDQGNIEYVKWDMNRSLMDVYSSVTRDQGRVLHDYVLGLYDFLERLVQRYPNLLIEGCSGGGGRFDAGMMYYTPQIWCSDNTDAIDRLRIQYGTSFGYPVSVVGSHVSAVPNHQTGRKTPLHTRGVVAMSGTFGYELNLMKLSEEEKQEIREQIAEYKSYASIIQNGLYYRLSNPTTEEICAWEFVHTDEKEQSKVLLNIVMQVIHGNMTVNYVKLQGLEETAVYREEKSGKRYTGAALMYGGMPLPIEPGEYQAYQYCFVKE
ncbi:alpha-galactosidase [Ruminococcus sp. AM29-19LB]|nr:alpha-galactosidase [Ruminococcus sp. AF19-4LB]RGH70324.1 alpha-galactosidase [Ruminococcus sp. AM29-5AC]RGH73902.1 alpha-galactosidase [Ruminococcus sp. AM29-1LB]RGH78774.1 alpha-galactosidase [Ruminococcus sp. AM29-19LB]RGH82029.1 alpha-galactosidase [Ruminococcus sp. AM29-10LB]RGH82447.1 alpha-galactosidase [Ruminococcus sp. AM29-1]